MNMSGFVAVLAWLSVFCLVWAILISEKFHTGQAFAALGIFAAIALISSSINSKKEESK